MISHLQCVLDCNLRGKIGKNSMWVKGIRWRLRELDCAAALPASSLYVCWPVGLTRLLWHPFLPLQRRLRRKETEVNAILSISESLEVLSFRCIPAVYWVGQKFVWAFVWKNPDEHFGQTNSLALGSQSFLPLLFGRLPSKSQLG